MGRFLRRERKVEKGVYKAANVRAFAGCNPRRLIIVARPYARVVSDSSRKDCLPTFGARVTAQLGPVAAISCSYGQQSSLHLRKGG